MEPQVGCESNNICHITWYAGIYLQHCRKILRGPVVRGGVSSSLLTAKLHSAMASFTFTASPTLHFHVKKKKKTKNRFCPRNVIKWPETMLHSPGVISYLSPKRVMSYLSPDKMMNMKWYNRVFWSCVRFDRLGQCCLFFFFLFFLPLQPSSIQNPPFQHLVYKN